MLQNLLMAAASGNLLNQIMSSFFAVGNAGKTFTSVDGDIWISNGALALMAGQAIVKVIYVDGLFIIVSSGNKIATSPDFINWTLKTPGITTGNSTDIIYVNGLYVLVGTSGNLSYSSDLINWVSKRTEILTVLGVNVIVNKIIYANGLYVAICDSGKIIVSSDLINWQLRASYFGTSNINGIAYINDVFVIVGASGKIATSPDGMSWTLLTTGPAATILNAIAYGDGMYIAVGETGSSSSNLATSPDGVTWTYRSYAGLGSLNYTDLYYVLFHDGLFYIFGRSTNPTIPMVVTTVDGINFSEVLSNGIDTAAINSVVLV